nr:hypothetical protein [Methylomonas sp. MK1]
MNALYDWFGMNQEIFYAVNSWHGPLIDALMLTGTAVGDFRNIPWILGAILLAIALRQLFPVNTERLPSLQGMKQLLMRLMLGYMVTAGIVALLKIGFDMPRPSAVLPRSCYRFGFAGIKTQFSQWPFGVCDADHDDVLAVIKNSRSVFVGCYGAMGRLVANQCGSPLFS